MKPWSVSILLLLLGAQCLAREVEYRIGGSRFNKAWHAFYVLADHESEIDNPLISAGRPMVPAICTACQHKDMKRRRYAIGALGFIGDRRALPTLESILVDDTEIDYFRGDALQSIYQIDRNLGAKCAEQYQSRTDTLGLYAKAVIKRKPWLLAPTN